MINKSMMINNVWYYYADALEDLPKETIKGSIGNLGDQLYVFLGTHWAPFFSPGDPVIGSKLDILAREYAGNPEDDKENFMMYKGFVAGFKIAISASCNVINNCNHGTNSELNTFVKIITESMSEICNE